MRFMPADFSFANFLHYLCVLCHIFENLMFLSVCKVRWVGLLSIITHEFYSLGKHLLAGAIHTGGAFRAKLLEV